MNLKLVISNKNYSSWSMRAWLMLKEAQIPFEEIMLKFNTAERFHGLKELSPSGRVPVLWIDHEPVWDSLAIAETLAEKFPEKNLWPQNPIARRYARSISAEMHSGFLSMRKAMPMNITASHPGKGFNEESAKDIRRIVSIWSETRDRFGTNGPMLFGHFSIADAMFAPVVMRFETYGVDLPPKAREYAASVRSLSSVQEWCAGAKLEKNFVPEDEPYAPSRTR